MQCVLKFAYNTQNTVLTVVGMHSLTFFRVSDQERAFGDFSMFDDTTAYAFWRFVYPNLSFDRLTAMMEFNILNNVDVIKSEIAELVERKRKAKQQEVKVKS